MRKEKHYGGLYGLYDFKCKTGKKLKITRKEKHYRGLYDLGSEEEPVQGAEQKHYLVFHTQQHTLILYLHNYM